MDVDGVLTDGRLYVGQDGTTFKSFFVRDGLGIKLLHQAGVETGVVSGRSDAYVRDRAEELGMSVVLLGQDDKAKAIDAILAERQLAAAHVAFLGDDVIDLPAMRRVGVAIAVADAHDEALAGASFVTRFPGGRGAVREVADLILLAATSGEPG